MMRDKGKKLDHDVKIARKEAGFLNFLFQVYLTCEFGSCA